MFWYAGLSPRLMGAVLSITLCMRNHYIVATLLTFSYSFPACVWICLNDPGMKAENHSQICKGEMNRLGMPWCFIRVCLIAQCCGYSVVVLILDNWHYYYYHHRIINNNILFWYNVYVLMLFWPFLQAVDAWEWVCILLCISFHNTIFPCSYLFDFDNWSTKKICIKIKIQIIQNKIQKKDFPQTKTYEVVKNCVWPTPFLPAYCRSIHYHTLYDVYKITHN